MKTTDFLVIGGGVIGLNIARELRARFPDQRVVLLEKEETPGLHASSRNSGVLHAGFYYTAESLKALFAREGNAALTAYCRERQLEINMCGKLVVAVNEQEAATLDVLLERARLNGVALEKITEAEARKIEPRARTLGYALFSPTTSTVNPAQVMAAMQLDAQNEGVEIRCDERYVRRDGNTVVSSRNRYDAGYVVNAAGLYADQIARDFGFSHEYRILPFKGLYLYSDEPAGAFRTHIYPVPDLRNPFLGVHLTVTVDGRAKIGPTATPAFWREQYEGFRNFRFDEFVDVSLREAALFFLSDFGFQRLAVEEIKKYFRPVMVRRASKIIRGLRPGQFTRWGRPGIRAQLIHTKRKKLEMDFVIQGDHRSCHVLNAVSPGFTCALPFSKHVCGRIENLVQHHERAGGEV